jgi:hypothetical protein
MFSVTALDRNQRRSDLGRTLMTLGVSPRSVYVTACCSDPGHDPDARLVHRLEPPGLLMRILVRDGADEVVASAALVDLARVPLDDDLVHQHLFEGIVEQDGLTALGALDAQPEQPRELESRGLDAYGQALRYDEEDHEYAEVISMPEAQAGARAPAQRHTSAAVLAGGCAALEATLVRKERRPAPRSPRAPRATCQRFTSEALVIAVR